MEMVRQIIREELLKVVVEESLPVPGDKDYIPHIHDPKLLFLDASHGRDMIRMFDSFLQELSTILSSRDLTSNELIKLVKALYTKTSDNFAKSKNEQRKREIQQGF